MKAQVTGFEAVIGIEVHVELLTDTKIFCPCSTGLGAEPNSQTCPVCLGMPGVLPVINKKVVDFAIRAALALGCEISPEIRFERKNYFYPDLPKGYQITSPGTPLGRNGRVDFTLGSGPDSGPDSDTESGPKQVRISGLHIEEEAAKSIHDEGDYTLVDFNRCGVPLVEIVSAPDMRTPEEARAYLQKLKTIIEYAGISDVKMAEGSLRCDANVSVMPAGSEEFGTLVELKNLNSFRAVKKGLEYEIERQIEVIRGGGRVVRETRGWDERLNRTVPQRSKEEAHDYRYFPEPDLLPISVDEAWIDRVAAEMPEPPDAILRRLVEDDGLPVYDAEVIVSSRDLVRFYDEARGLYEGDPKFVSNWLMGDLLGFLNAEGKELAELPLTPEHLVQMLRLMDTGTISSKIAKTVFEEMARSGKSPEEVVEEKGLVQISDEDQLLAVVREVIGENPGPVEQFLGGKEQVLGFLVGQVMKKTRGKANPQMANDLLRMALNEG